MIPTAMGIIAIAVLLVVVFVLPAFAPSPKAFKEIYRERPRK